MNDSYIIDKLEEIRKEKNWSYYKLAKEADMPLSTVQHIFKRTRQPSFSTLLRICYGLGISMTQFFNENEEIVFLSDEEKIILEKWHGLDKMQKERVLAYMDGLKMI